MLYPQMLTFPLAMEFFGSEYCPRPAMGTVHLANRIAQHAILKAGDDLLDRELQQSLRGSGVGCLELGVCE